MKKRLRDNIISALKNGQIDKVLFVEMMSKEYSVSIQAVYKVLRALQDEEVIIDKAKTIALNTVWLENEIDVYETARKNYFNKDLDQSGVAQLEEGDRITYRFKNWDHLDQVWGHFLLQLVDIQEKEMPIFLYNPYYWFPLTRYKSEYRVFKWIQDRGSQAFVVTPSKEELNKNVTKDFITKFHHTYSIGNNFGFKMNHYFNVIGDYIIDVSLDATISNELDKFYKDTKKMSEEDRLFLIKLFSQRGKNKLVISKNARKARILRKKLAKDFLIPEKSRAYL